MGTGAAATAATGAATPLGPVGAPPAPLACAAAWRAAAAICIKRCSRKASSCACCAESCVPLLTAVLIFTVTFLIYMAFSRLSIFYDLPKAVQNAHNENPALFFLLIYLCLTVTTLILCCKHILIGIVKVYQHYAPEEVRRRCICKPTCSEYTILALQKYGVIIGLYKAYIRIVKKCRGSIYRIDYPFGHS